MNDAGVRNDYDKEDAARTEQERRDAKKAQLYDLRLIFTNGEKDTYTTQEIVELLDKIAMADNQ